MRLRVKAWQLTSGDFLKLALSLAANAENDAGYKEYMDSVSLMFDGLAEGKFPSHKEVFASVVRSVCGREPLKFKQWLEMSPYKARLGSLTS